MDSSSGVCVGGQTDGHSAEEPEALLSLYMDNNQQSGKKTGFRAGQTLRKHHSTELLSSGFCVVLLQPRFPGLSQMDLVITLGTAEKPKVHIFIPYIVLRT